jgi:hypothetical protein
MGQKVVKNGHKIFGSHGKKWVFFMTRFCYAVCAIRFRIFFASRAVSLNDLHPKKTGFHVRKWYFTTPKTAR